MTLKSLSANDLAVLGIEPGATTDEIHCAYRKKLEMWQEGALPTYNLLEPEERQELLDAIEAAYSRLLTANRLIENHLTQPKEDVDLDQFGPAPDPVEEPGPHLRFKRQRLGLSLKNVEEKIKVNHQQLKAIEEQCLEGLPAPVFVRGFVVAYAELLKVKDPTGFVKRYLEKLTASDGGL